MDEPIQPPKATVRYTPITAPVMSASWRHLYFPNVTRDILDHAFLANETPPLEYSDSELVYAAVQHMGSTEQRITSAGTDREIGIYNRLGIVLKVDVNSSGAEFLVNVADRVTDTREDMRIYLKSLNAGRPHPFLKRCSQPVILTFDREKLVSNAGVTPGGYMENDLAILNSLLKNGKKKVVDYNIVPVFITDGQMIAAETAADPYGQIAAYAQNNFDEFKGRSFFFLGSPNTVAACKSTKANNVRWHDRKDYPHGHLRLKDITEIRVTTRRPSKKTSGRIKFESSKKTKVMFPTTQLNELYVSIVELILAANPMFHHYHPHIAAEWKYLTDDKKSTGRTWKVNSWEKSLSHDFHSPRYGRQNAFTHEKEIKSRMTNIDNLSSTLTTDKTLKSAVICDRRSISDVYEHVFTTTDRKLMHLLDYVELLQRNPIPCPYNEHKTITFMDLAQSKHVPKAIEKMIRSDLEYIGEKTESNYSVSGYGNEYQKRFNKTVEEILRNPVHPIFKAKLEELNSDKPLRQTRNRWMTQFSLSGPLYSCFNMHYDVENPRKLSRLKTIAVATYAAGMAEHMDCPHIIPFCKLCCKISRTSYNG